jgi:phosphoesterase RecJ-like protein
VNRGVKKNISSVIREINRAASVAICVHMFPDGDAIGSMVALALALRSKGKRVALFSPNKPPKRYEFLSLYPKIHIGNKNGVRYDLAIAVDCASPEQLGALYGGLFKTARKTLEIDHHGFRKTFADLSFLDHEAAAVGEMIYALVKSMRLEISRSMAEAILISLIVETGSFRLPSVNKKTVEFCADLVGRGVNYYSLVQKSYWSRTRSEVYLLGLCLSRIKFYLGGRIAVSFVHAKDLRDFRGREEDIDPVIDQIRTLKSVLVAVFFREMKGRKWRVSLRSKERFNVGRVAELFGGGGHADVAGCYLPRTQRAKSDLMRELMRLISRR